MESETLDISVERLEKLLSEINQINFKIEGFKEEIDGWEKNFPKVFRRQIDLNNRRIYKLSTVAANYMIEKEHLESIVGQHRLEQQAKKKEETKKVAKVEKK